jgi:organic hydroperoxide reductase OsmC/OhrA
MAESSYSYESTVRWAHDRQGSATAAGRPSLVVGAPPEFGGTAEVWSPEHLTAAAVNACLMLTFIAIAANSKLPFTAYEATATATLEKVEGRGMVITRVVVQPRISVPPGTDRTKLDRILRMTEKHCVISNSLQAAVSFQPEIHEG